MCCSLELLGVELWTQLHACDCTQRSSCPFPCLTWKLCWCQMTSCWQLDVGRSILTGSPVSPAFCSPSKAVLTLPQSLSCAPPLSLFGLFPSPLLTGLYHQPQSAAVVLICQSRIQAGLLSGLELLVLHEELIIIHQISVLWGFTFRFSEKTVQIFWCVTEIYANILIFTVLLALQSLNYSLQTDW